MTKHHLSSNPRRQSVPESQAHRKHPVERAQEWGLHRRQKRLLWDPCGLLTGPSGHKAPTDNCTRPSLGRRQNEGAEALAAGASLGTKETAGRRPQGRSALASHLNCGYRPAAPLPLPPRPARPPRLSVSFLPPYWPARVHFRSSGYSVLIRAGARGAGGCGGGAATAAPGRSPAALVANPCTAAPPRPPGPSAARWTLRRVGRCCCCAPGRALCDGCREAGERSAARTPGQHGWKSPSTSPSCRESRKVRAGPWSARRAPPAPSAGSLRGGPSSAAPRLQPLGAHRMPARRGREEIEFRFCCGTLGKSPKF